MADRPEGESARMLESPTLREFWEFATTVRRTRSLAERESSKLRGTWLTSSLAVQRVHGWGARAVRLLCVHAESEDRAAKLRLFFQKDRHNLEGRLATAKDPLDREKRVVVKIPYDVSLAGCVEHERAVLRDLAGLEGVPTMAEPVYFEDIGVPAATYRYSSAPSLQEQLEAGNLVPPEGLHRLLSCALSVLARAHKRGWLHTDLHPRDVLLDTAGAGAARPEGGAPAAPSLLCGWAHAVRPSDGDGPDLSQGLAELVRRLPVTIPKPVRGRPAAESALEGADTLSQVFNSEAEVAAPAAASVEDSSPVSTEGRRGREAGGPSTFSAPEQLLGLYAGVGHDAASTDVYRAAAVALVAVRARGPLGTAERPMDPGAARSVEQLRRLCHGALRRRAESAGVEALPTADETAEFATTLEQLVAEEIAGGAAAHPSSGACSDGTSRPRAWFHRCLAREPRERYQSAEEALEAFDEAWASLEARSLQERRDAEEAAEAARAAGEAAAANRRPRLVLEAPEELEEMKVL